MLSIWGENAEHDLDETRDIYTWPDIETAQKDVDNAKSFLQYALDAGLPELTVTYAQERLDAAEAILDAKINSYDTEEVAIARMEVQAAEMSLTKAQKDLDGLTEDISLKELQLEIEKIVPEQILLAEPTGTPQWQGWETGQSRFSQLRHFCLNTGEHSVPSRWKKRCVERLPTSSEIEKRGI